MNQKNDTHCLTTDEVAKDVQVSKETILRAVRRGKLPAIRIGREYRYFRDDVRKWLDSLRYVAEQPGNPQAGEAQA